MPRKLLLADDSVTMQKVVAIVFAHEDYQVTAVANGDDAIARARELKPDIVLADVMMPGKDGYEVCAAIKADPATSHIPVLLLAGSFEPFDESRARAASFDGHLPKPFESAQLLERVRQLVDGHRGEAGAAPAAAVPSHAPPRPAAPSFAAPTFAPPAFAPPATPAPTFAATPAPTFAQPATPAPTFAPPAPPPGNLGARTVPAAPSFAGTMPPPPAHRPPAPRPPSSVILPPRQGMEAAPFPPPSFRPPAPPAPRTAIPAPPAPRAPMPPAPALRTPPPAAPVFASSPGGFPPASPSRTAFPPLAPPPAAPAGDPWATPAPARALASDPFEAAFADAPAASAEAEEEELLLDVEEVVDLGDDDLLDDASPAFERTPGFDRAVKPAATDFAEPSYLTDTLVAASASRSVPVEPEPSAIPEPERTSTTYLGDPAPRREAAALLVDTAVGRRFEEEGPATSGKGMAAEPLLSSPLADSDDLLPPDPFGLPDETPEEALDGDAARFVSSASVPPPADRVAAFPTISEPAAAPASPAVSEPAFPTVDVDTQPAAAFPIRQEPAQPAAPAAGEEPSFVVEEPNFALPVEAAQPSFAAPSAPLEGRLAADGGEAALRDAISAASREVIEKIAWEVVPQLAEVILREHVERLVRAREGGDSN